MLLFFFFDQPRTVTNTKQQYIFNSVSITRRRFTFPVGLTARLMPRYDIKYINSRPAGASCRVKYRYCCTGVLHRIICNIAALYIIIHIHIIFYTRFECFRLAVRIWLIRNTYSRYIENMFHDKHVCLSFPTGSAVRRIIFVRSKTVCLCVCTCSTIEAVFVQDTRHTDAHKPSIGHRYR